jgi:hypothetical protein
VTSVSPHDEISIERDGFGAEVNRSTLSQSYHGLVPLAMTDNSISYMDMCQQEG